jgi:hypothetical protein
MQPVPTSPPDPSRKGSITANADFGRRVANPMPRTVDRVHALIRHQSKNSAEPTTIAGARSGAVLVHVRGLRELSEDQ